MDDYPYMPDPKLWLNRLDDFKNWLAANGWHIRVPRNECELMRASKSGKRPLVVYKITQRVGGRAITHYSITAGYEGILREFVNEMKEATNNGKSGKRTGST
jgi:hypothetical protein